MIILTMLGTGNYETTTYTWGEHQKHTSLFPIALKNWFPSATIKALVTPEAREKHGKTLLDAHPDTELIDINMSDPWNIYQQIENHIPENAQIILDMTHGFRSLPMLALLTVSFLRTAKRVKLEHLLYGAFEAKTQNETPVFDLTPFVTMLDWANATSRFLETGDARKFKELVSIRAPSVMNNVGNELEKLSVELALHHSTEAMNTAKRVLEKIKQTQEVPSNPEHQPFQLLRDRILIAVQPIAGVGNASEIYSQYAQIIWYAKQKQFAQAISLAREWLVAVRIWKTDGWFSVSREEQEIAEYWLNTMAKALKEKPQIIPPKWLAAVKMWDKISDQRNDYAHFGMRKSVISAKETLKNAQIILDELRIAVAQLELELPEVSE